MGDKLHRRLGYKSGCHRCRNPRRRRHSHQWNSSWVQMYFEKLIKKTGKTIADNFPNFHFFIYGGVNFEPYKNKFETLIGKKMDYIELYPASEGFIAFQDTQTEKGMLLQLNSGIFTSSFQQKNFLMSTQPEFP